MCCAKAINSRNMILYSSFFFLVRIRMEHVERQLASLTGLVQTALTGSTSQRGPENNEVNNQPVRDGNIR